MRDVQRDLRLLLVDPDVEHRTHLERVISTLPMNIVGGAAHGIDAAHRAAELHPDVVIVHVEEPLDLGARTLQAVQNVAPAAVLIAVSRSNDTGLVQNAMLAGARGFLVTPTTRNELEHTVRTALQRHQALLRRASQPDQPDPTVVAGKVITLFGPKGGVGRTTVATNLAISLAALTRARVALVDADAQFGDVAINLGIEAEATLPELLTALTDGREAEIAAYMTRHDSGIYVLCAGHAAMSVAEIDPDVLADVIRRVATTFDFVVVDTAAGLDAPVAATLDESTMVLLLTSMDMSSLKDARQATELLERGGFDLSRVRLVVNPATSVAPVAQGDIVSALGREVFWTLPRDRNAPWSTQRGEPLVLSRPRSRLSRAIESLAVHLSGEQPVRRSWFGLFR